MVQADYHQIFEVGVLVSSKKCSNNSQVIKLAYCNPLTLYSLYSKKEKLLIPLMYIND